MEVLTTNKLTELPTHDTGLEKSVLYCLVHEKNIQHKIYKLGVEDFYNSDNRRIFQELKKITDMGEAIIPNTLPMSLKADKVFLDIVTQTTLISEFDSYLKKLKEISDTRKMQKIAYEVTVKAKEELNPQEIRGWAISQFDAVRGYSDIEFQKQTEDIDADLENVLNDNQLIAVKSGYLRLDKITRGFLKSSLNIVASAAGMGKSTFILNLINHICYKQKKRVLFVSLEMDYKELHGKMISLISGIGFQRLIFENDTLTTEEWDMVNNARAQISQYSLYRIGETETRPVDIEDVVKDLKDIDIIFIDYLQLMTPNIYANNIREKITELSRELKVLARKTKIPIVAISSINRDYSRRDDKKPRISDLRESGQIEYDAGTVLLLHRECKFRDAKDENPIEFEKKAELLIAKNRFGEDNLIIDFYFEGARGRFTEMEREGQEGSKFYEQEYVAKEKEYRDFSN